MEEAELARAINLSMQLPPEVQVDILAKEAEQAAAADQAYEVMIIEATDPLGVVKLDTTVDVDVVEDAHVVVAAFGEQRYPDGLPNFDPDGVPRVLTNPIFVDVDGDGVFGGAPGRECAYTLGR